MATTTAAITITSTDLTTDSLSLSTTATLTKAGTANGLTSTTGLGRKQLATGHAQYTLFDGDAYGDGAHKIYLKNTSTTDAEFFTIEINSEQMGKLYAGDWAFFPWEANADTNDIKIDPSADNMVLEYMLIYEQQMAFTPRLNLTASSGTTVGPINILTAGDNAGAISSILVSNRTSDKELTVDLYLYNNTTAVTVYIVKSALIPVGSSLKLNVGSFGINTRLNQDNAIIKVTMDSSVSSATNVADVIIGKK